MFQNIQFEATLLKKLAYPFFSTKICKKIIFFDFAAKITYSDTGAFSKNIFDHLQVFKKTIRTYYNIDFDNVFGKARILR